MSKAFTRENDEVPAPATGLVDLRLPAGVSNYVTASGARHLREELSRLIEVDRAAAAPGRAREEIDRRIQFLTAHLDCAEIIDPRQQDTDRALFGATVTVRDGDDREHPYRIVGVAEADPRSGRVSWLSPLARVLLGSEVGDTVAIPGHAEMEVVSICYES